MACKQIGLQLKIGGKNRGKQIVNGQKNCSIKKKAYHNTKPEYAEIWLPPTFVHPVKNGSDRAFQQQNMAEKVSEDHHKCKRETNLNLFHENYANILISNAYYVNN